MTSPAEGFEFCSVDNNSQTVKMASKIGDVKIKVESSNELQTYLQSFNKEIEGVDPSIQVLQEDGTDDDDDEGGRYLIDHCGNYYYQASKDSEAILTNPPEDIGDYTEDGDNEDMEINENNEEYNEDYDDDAKVEFSTKKTVIQATENGDEVSYVLIMDDGDNEKQMNEKSEVYEFDPNEEQSKPDDNEKEIDDKKIVLKLIKSERNTSIMHACHYCNYSSPKRYLLARHMKCHSEERPHRCSVCERGFKTHASLQNHINTHTGNKPHHCKDCTSTFTTSGELVRHVRYRHTHEKPHKCTECDYASVELSKLKRHIRCHTGERPYQCPHCTYASPDTFKLKRHLRIHTGEKPYECDICHARFTQSNSLKAHKLIHSVGNKPVFQCELCPTTCGRKTDLRIHVQKLHTSDKPLKCKRCDKQFPDRYSYKVHSKTHEGEKCYKCDLCPYASISARHLESHMLIHIDQKPYECDTCDQAFRQKQLLKRHINLYHNKNYVPPQPREKTHICPHCDRCFRHKGNLIRHMAIHDPDSCIKEEAIALKVGRRKRIQFIDGQPVEILPEGEEYEGEEDDELCEILETDVSEIADIKPNETKSLVAVKGTDGQQYVVLEVIQVEDDENGQIQEENENIVNDEDYNILSGLPSDVINTLRASKKLRTEPKKMLGDDKNMENCFGFDDDEETNRQLEDEETNRQLEDEETNRQLEDEEDPDQDVVDDDDEDDERHHKSTIKLLNMD